MAARLKGESLAFFLAIGRDQGQRFCIYHPPGEPCRGRVLHIHGFAEEMNKSRRMSALQARDLARHGFAVLQIDLFGCGDSDGEFGDATWTQWLADLTAGSAYLAREHDAPLTLWAQRAGCLLATDLAESLGETCQTLFWQPMNSGETQLQQLLRLKQMADLFAGTAIARQPSVKERLNSGETVEIAGYALSANLARSLAHARLRPPRASSKGFWFELSTHAKDNCSPALQRTAEEWRLAGFQLQTRSLTGPQFWQSQEIEEAHSLIEASTRSLLGSAA
ncbi:hydrolase 2, exosortase A system-associated [Paucibacter sp. AS339]|uniref:hydrolase 2, exosortase A system-associated n=1 Tax=Paucibacter hankyongi TaxID=3133434 RepID=UPI0030A1437A